MVYAPGTDERDPQKQNMSLQQNAAQNVTNATNIATNTTNIATNTAAITALQAGPLVSGAVATQADQETGTSTTLAVTPGRQKYHPAHAKAWAYVTQSAGTYTLAASFGVTSISKSATGVVDVTLSTAFSSTNFAAIATNNTGGALASEIIGSRTTTNVRVDLRAPNTTANVDGNFSLIVFGDQ